MAVRDGSAAARASALGGASAAMVHFLAGFLLAAGRMLGAMAPFGVAAVAASPRGLRGAGALAGACLGYLVTGSLEWGIRYAAACSTSFPMYCLLYLFG